MNCGTRLSAAAGASTEAAKITGTSGSSNFLGRYLPPELVVKLEAARARGGMAGERRVITMLFSDVKGSTAAAEQVDPELWTEIMNGVFERMIEPIYKYEGTVPRLMGDAILAFFGAPIAHEDDPQRAVWAGLDIQAAMRPYAAQVRSRYGLDIGLRVGINTGLVVVGEIGSDLRLEYTAIGDAINVAARMEQTAAPGTIQVTDETHKLIAPLFDFEPLGGIEVKGKAEPVIAYRVLGRRAEPGHLRGLEGLSSPLVGRDEQLGLLRKQLGALEEGAGGFVAVVGEAGLGKSSLIAELQKIDLPAGHADRALAAASGTAETNGGGEPIYSSAGPRWLAGEGMAHARSVSYFPWRQIVRRSIGAREDDPPAEVRNRLSIQCDCCKLPGGDMPFLEAMLAVESQTSLQVVAGYEGEALVSRMIEAVRGYLCGLASERPLVLVFDDLHWADEASLALLLNASDLVSGQPILFLCMLRPDKDAPSWRAIEEVQGKLAGRSLSIMLQALAAEQTDALLGNLLGTKTFPARLKNIILEKAGGNPFFIEELIRSLIDTGQVVRENDHWRAVADDALMSLPGTLRGVLGARIDRLPETARHVLQMAAVIGRTFDVRVLKSLARVDILDEELIRLKEAGLLERQDLQKGTRLEGEMVFRHALIQEAAYDSILIKKRSELHRRVGEALEEFQAGRIDEFAPLLAHHFFQAHDDRSLKYDVLAGEKAARLYANAEAAMHYHRALETAKGIGTDSLYTADLFTKLGGVLELSGRYGEALSTYEDMRGFAHERSIPSAELGALMAKATIYSTPTALRDHELGEQTMLQALELSNTIGDVTMQTRLNWNMMLNCLHSRRIDTAFEYGQRALALARQGADTEQLAFVLNDLGRVMVCRGQFDDALDVIREARGLWGSLENRVMQADNLGAEEEALYSMGRFDQVLQVGAQALQICDELDNAWGKSYHRLLMGLAQVGRGDVPQAIELISKAIDMGDQGGLIISSIAGRCDLAWCYGLNGEIDKGLALVAMAMETAKASLPDWAVMPVAMRIRLYALRGDRAAAEQAAEGTELIPPTLAYPHYSMMVGLARVELARWRGDFAGMLAITDALLAEMQDVLPAEAPLLLRCKADALKALGKGE